MREGDAARVGEFPIMGTDATLGELTGAAIVATGGAESDCIGSTVADEDIEGVANAAGDALAAPEIDPVRIAA